MRIRFQVFYCAMMLMLVCSCTSSINVIHIDTKNENTDNRESKKDLLSKGIYYSLPKTVITANVTVEKTDKIKGPYASYALKYLGLANVIEENSTSYTIKSLTLSGKSIPDDEQYYFIDCSKIRRKSLSLNFGEEGMITGICKKNMELKNIFPDTSVAGDDKYFNEHEFLNSNIALAFDTTIEKINLDSTVITKKNIKKVYVTKTAEQKAQEAAALILKLEEAKIDLYAGYSEVNYSKETIQYMVEKIEKMEKEYINLFTGAVVKHTQKYSFTYIPVKGKTNIPLFRMSDKFGICDTSDYKGEAVYLAIKPIGNTDVLKSFDESRADAKEKNHGIYYRIPANACVSLIQNEKQIASSDILISQLGMISEMNNNNVKSVFLYPETGSVKKIILGKGKPKHFHHH